MNRHQLDVHHQVFANWAKEQARGLFGAPKLQSRNLYSNHNNLRIILRLWWLGIINRQRRSPL